MRQNAGTERPETPPGQSDADPQAHDSWLKKVQDADLASTSFAETNWQSQWMKNLHMFQSRHVPGSKYNHASYRFRSKLFRPKTRTAIRNTEAAGAASFFSSMDVVNIQPVGESPEQKAGAKFHKELLTYRLQMPEMHWFLTVIGGLQDSQKMGVVSSYNYWEHANIEGEKPKDHPCVRLVPVNQIKFHPGAHWVDPINTSPYVIYDIPMFIQDVKEKEDFAECTDEEFQKALIGDDVLQQVRNQHQQNPQQMSVGKINDYSMVWVKLVFMREKGRRVCFYTLGTSKRLTDPVPLSEKYWHGEIPITLGYFILESHRAMAPGVPELGEQLQKEANEIANSRQDNVKLAIHKRYIARRGGVFNIRGLINNVAGSVTYVDDIEKDIRELEWNDVTRSSYEEQSRLDVDFDGIVGGFNAGTVQTNRSLNETVGGMAMLKSASGEITDYGLKTFAETWMEPTLRQVVKLIQHYESDETAIMVAAEKAQIVLEYMAQLEELMGMDLLLTVDIGVGNSNPGFRLERFIAGIKAYTELLANAPPGINMQAVGEELFGYLGYKDGSRFFDLENQDDPRIMQMQQALQELQQQIEAKVVDNEGKMALQAQKDAAEMERQEDKNIFELVKTVIQENQKQLEDRMGELEQRNSDLESVAQNLAKQAMANYTSNNGSQ